MTFFPFASVLKANDSDDMHELTALDNDKLLTKAGLTITSVLVSANQINNINFPSPLTATQIANKQYVDDVAADVLASVSLDDQAFIKTDGSRSMRNDLQMDGYSITGLRDPLSLTEAATKNYVDLQISDILGDLSFADLDFFKTDGSRPMQGSLDLDGYSIVNLRNPSSPQDAATKEYVDSLSRLAVAAVSADYQITTSDRVIFADTSAQQVFLDLPSAVGQAGLFFNIKRLSAGDNDVYVRAQAGETLDGESAIPLLLQWESMTVVSNGTNWHIM